MLIGMLYSHIPGIHWDASWQFAMGILFLLGVVCFYLGCLRAARLAEKAYFMTKNHVPKTDPPVQQD